MLGLIQEAKLIKQGAEAKVYKVDNLYPCCSEVYYPKDHPDSSITSSISVSSSPFLSQTSNLPPSYPILLKHRFAKKYRHPSLDQILTRQRLVSEARALLRCKKAGVNVPGLRVCDLPSGVLGIEWIEGWSVRQILGGGQEEDEEEVEEEEQEESWSEVEDANEPEEDSLLQQVKLMGLQEDDLLKRIGKEIATMHLADVIHGDLTTSNMMVRFSSDRGARDTSIEQQASRLAAAKLTEDTLLSEYEVILIDFGLSSTSFDPEDRAVDLYVLERAFASTHPEETDPEVGGSTRFEVLLKGYEQAFVDLKGKKGNADWNRVEKRLEEVRLRGRKRSMVG